MFYVQAPSFLSELRIKDRFQKRDFRTLFRDFFHDCEAPTYRAVVVVSHSGTISNMLYSHTDKQEEEVLKPRNASVIAINDAGRLGLQHEGSLPECKNDEWHEYFTVPQFEQFAGGVHFDYAPPRSCLLLLVRHGIALNNVNKAFTDGNLTREGEGSVLRAAARISSLLQQHGISSVGIFSSACMRTRHSSQLLYEALRARQAPTAPPELPRGPWNRCGCAARQADEPCLQEGCCRLRSRRSGGAGGGCGEEILRCSVSASGSGGPCAT